MHSCALSSLFRPIFSVFFYVRTLCHEHSESVHTGRHLNVTMLFGCFQGPVGTGKAAGPSCF